MNIRQKYTVERIVREMAAANKDKPLNELKRMIKEQIRLEVDQEIASKIGIDEIIKIISEEKRQKEESNLIVKKRENKSNRNIERER